MSDTDRMVAAALRAARRVAKPGSPVTITIRRSDVPGTVTVREIA